MSTLFACCCVWLSAAEYDPLALPNAFQGQTLELAVQDSARQREIPVKVYLPDSHQPAPVVLFSHGLGGTREGSAYLGKHWSGRGYVAVFLQHPGSDDSVWRDEAASKRMGAMQQAASAQNLLLRVRDVPAVLDRLAAWNAESGHALAGRLDLEHVGMSGHSFGAVTTQSVSGQSAPAIGPRFTDPRIKAAIPMSPSSPRRGNVQTAFSSVTIPWLLMTGTKDTAPIGDQTVESRLAVFSALPPGDKYELVLDKAEHSAFSDRALPGDSEPRNPNHHRAILALSTAFWDAYLRRDPAAKAWLEGPGPRGILQPEDRWQKK
jgi:predicted dienelactone hydrolase